MMSISETVLAKPVADLPYLNLAFRQKDFMLSFIDDLLSQGHSNLKTMFFSFLVS